jgi:hypothetical protein
MARPREFKSVSSSMIRGVAYDGDTEQLYVEFNTGAVWEYDGVPAEEYEAMLGSGSVGSFFHNNIKDSYSARRA